MSILPILLWPNPELNRRCAAIDTIDDALRTLASDMLETMYAARGRGLAGPQVGVMRRIFVMDVTWREGAADPQVMINPDILSMSETRATGAEGCLSLPGVTLEISRATALRLRWTSLSEAVTERDLEGIAAVCAQHEFDHLDGVMTLDRITPSARAKLLAGYGA